MKHPRPIRGGQIHRVKLPFALSSSSLHSLAPLTAFAGSIRSREGTAELCSDDDDNDDVTSECF